MKKEEFEALVQEFLKTKPAEFWPGLHVTGPAELEYDEWVQPGAEENGPVLFVLHDGEIYVEEI